ncbi:MAG: cupin [Acidimicrobiales bacterium]|nr:cupin [Acidimicrobiales bacterium]
MTQLTVWPEDQPEQVLLRTDDFEAIRRSLAEVSVRLDRPGLAPDLPRTGTQEELLDAYRSEIERIAAEEGYAEVDVAQLHPSDDPGWKDVAAQARQRFLSEHTHADDEVRLFVDGAGIFYLRLDGRVHAVLCTAGDLMSVPKGTRHWFDMGTRPDFTAIRFFHDENGWVGDFTGDEIALRFPDFDTLAGVAASGPSVG